MNKNQKRRTGLFDEPIIPIQDFWSNDDLTVPTRFNFKSLVYIKTQKKLLSDFSIKNLILNKSILYLVGKKKNKVYKSVDLSNIPCKLYDFTLPKTKHPYKIVLRHHSMSAEFFFHEKDSFDHWINHLREICMMCDFTSVYGMGNLIVNSSLCRIYWAQDKLTGKPYSAKVYNTLEDCDSGDDIQAKIEKQVIINEIKALRKIDHPNILKLKEVHEFKDRVVMVKELITGSTLLRHIISQGSLPEQETVHIMKTLLKALQAIHEKKIIHRNLKPENILLNHSDSGTELKLTAFGFSCSTDMSERTSWHISKNICSKCGTPGYMAPELLKNKKSTTAADIFSMGVILYTCLTGEPMFPGKSAEDIIFRNLKVNFERTNRWYSLSDSARDLILNMVREDPTERPSIDNILKHSFFCSNNKLNPNVGLHAKFTWQSTGETEHFLKTKRNSIDEIMACSDRSKISTARVMQSLIVSPTYFDFTKGEMPEVPEFYIEQTDDFMDMLDNYESRGIQSASKGTKISLGLKIELLRGSVNQLDPGEGTPKFKIKYPQNAEEQKVDVLSEDEDEDLSEDLDETNIAKNYFKLNTFTTFTNSPFISQKPMVQKFNTINFKNQQSFKTQPSFNTQQSFGQDPMMTRRELPEVQNDLRKKLEAKSTMLESLKTTRNK